MKKLCDMTPEEQADYLNLLAGAIDLLMPGNSAGDGRCLFMVFVMDPLETTTDVCYTGNVHPTNVAQSFRLMADKLEAEGPDAK